MDDRNRLARDVLDPRLAALRDAAPAVPARGWIRAVREALGMSQADLGRRLGVTKQAVLQMEISEAGGTIRISTLRRAAEALGCTLVYATVPDGSLEQTVEDRARLVAARVVDRASHTMLLEDQSTAPADTQRLVDDLAAEAKRSRDLWRD